MSEGQSVGAQVYYELRSQPGTIKLGVEGQLHVFERGAAAIVMVVVMDNIIMSEKVVAVIEDIELMRLRSFVQQGGRLRLEDRLK